MGTKMMSGVSIVSSPFLDPLTDRLVHAMSDRPADPFASDLIVVPNVGVRDWLQRELCARLDAGRAGIVANVRFMFVQQFLDAVFTASGADATRAWDIEHLTWTVHRAIDVIGRPAVPGATTKPLTVARVVADLFDRYGVHRPSMLRYWKAGRAVDGVEPVLELPPHLQWQQRLYAEVCRLIAQDSPVDRIADLGDRIRESGLPQSIPDRLALFGFVTMNTTMRVVLDAVGAARTVDVYLVHPAPQHEPPRTASGLVAREHGNVLESGNQLLARWGRPIIETRQVLSGDWTSVGPEPAPRITDLVRLRQSIVDDRPLDLVPIVEGDDHAIRGDGSIQVHACHGRVRQVEVLRDALLHLLQDDPTLTTSDISIQCPDLVAFAPIIPAVFAAGRSAGRSTPPALDVSIADRVLVGENPYHDAFWSILDLARARCGVGEMLTMLAAGPIRRRFELDDDMLSRLSDWADALAVRFGLDVDHRRTWDVPESITVGTWNMALDRLFMGMAVPAETPFEGPGGIVPFDDVAVSDAPTLARLADFLVALRRLVGRVNEPHSAGEWAGVLTSIVDDFFDHSENQDFACRDLLDALDRLANAAQTAGVGEDDLFSFDDIIGIVRDLVVASGARPRFRSGAITVTELLPQQGVPYRVIALLGANESMFAAGGVRGDDVLALRPCVGDPMPTASGRLQFLDVILAARDAVIITCDGADINNNKPIPLPVPIQELVEAASAVIAEADSTPQASGSAAEHRGCRVLTRHPRQSFALRSLSAGFFRIDRPFTFDPVSLDVHALLDQPARPLLAGRRVDESSTEEEMLHPSHRVAVRSMRRAISRPVDYFVQDVLGLRLPESDSRSGQDVVDFWPSALEYARVGREILDRVLRSPDAPSDVVGGLIEHMRLGGVFPPGRLGDKAAAQVTSEVLSIVELLPQAARSSVNHRSMDIDDMPLVGHGDAVVSGTIENVIGVDLVRASFTKFRDDMVLDPWIDLAVLGCFSPDEAWTVRMVGRGSKGEAVARAFRLAGSDRHDRLASAQRVLTTVRTLMDRMAIGRVPYLPKTSEKMARATVASAQSVYEDEGEYSSAIQFLFGKVTWDDFLAEEPLADDPIGRGESRAERFASFVWDAFTDTTVPVAVGGS